MKRDLAETVDRAASRLAAGEPLPAVLAAFPAEQDALAPLLHAVVRVQSLAEAPLPDVHDLATDRQAFLEAAAARRRHGADPAHAVSMGLLVRLKGWMERHKARLASATGVLKERKMAPLLVRAALILTLALGSLGGTLAVAADSLPDSPVYPVKLVVERTRLALTADPAGEARLHLAYAAERIAEMEKVVNRGGTPDEATMERLNLHLREAVAIAAHQPEESMVQILTRAHHLVQTQVRITEQVRSAQGEPARVQVEAMYRLGRQIQQRLRDPKAFRNRHGAGRPGTAPPQPDLGPGSGPVITHTRTVTVPHSYGPGPGGNPDCPQAGDCEPQGDQQQHQGPPPEPGDYGDQDCAQMGESCEPEGEQHQHGAGGEQPGPGGEPAGTPNQEQGGNGGAHGSGGGGQDAGQGDGDQSGGGGSENGAPGGNGGRTGSGGNGGK